MNNLLIKNAVLGETLKKANIAVEDGKIVSADYCGNVHNFDRIIDAEDLYALPGFVELHAHGGGGYDFMDLTEEAFVNISKTHSYYNTDFTYLLDKNFHISFQEECLMVEEQFEAPILQIELDANIPWVLDKENTY